MSSPIVDADLRSINVRLSITMLKHTYTHEGARVRVRVCVRESACCVSRHAHKIRPARGCTHTFNPGQQQRTRQCVSIIIVFQCCREHTHMHVHVRMLRALASCIMSTYAAVAHTHTQAQYMFFWFYINLNTSIYFICSVLYMHIQRSIRSRFCIRRCGGFILRKTLVTVH